MRKKRYIGTRFFSGEVGLSADDEVRGSEVIECGEDLGRIECWI